MGKSFYKVTTVMSIVYIVVVSIFLVLHRAWFSPDQFFIAALLITILIGRSKQFLKDWSIPVTLFLSYDYLRGLVPKLSLQAHIFPMINFDKKIFGVIPTNELQSKLFASGIIHWYDYLAVVFYLSHFIVPMLLAFIFWLKDREYFREYTMALLILSYGAFITYILFPAMPPWMAAQQGFIPAVDKVMDQVFASFPNQINLPSIYRFIGVNIVAAVPSLHAAYPWLTFLFVIRKVKLWGLLLIPYVLGVWFAIIYMGEHYVFDLIVGVLYASVAFTLVVKGDMIWRQIRLFRKTTRQRKVLYE